MQAQSTTSAGARTSTSTSTRHERDKAQDGELTYEMWTKDLGREHDFEPLRVEGTLPPALRGTLFRNGPGQFGQFGRRYTHAFEGDGAVTAIRIANGRATGAARITPTAGLVDERAAGHLKYGLTAPWHRRIANVLRGRDKNTANTSVAMWQGRLFALMEGGKPTELDPQTLAFRGETDLDRTIVGFFSAHPHRVESRATLYNFGLEYGRRTRLHCYALPDVGAARHLAAIELPGPPMLHDFIATDTHLVFFVSPVRVNVPRMLLSLGGFDKMFGYKPELGTEVICVPIDDPTNVVRFTAPAFYQWHFANAFTRSTTELVVDYVRYPDFSSFHAIGDFAAGTRKVGALAEGRFHRATIDLAARSLRSEPLADRTAEFPTVALSHRGREHDLVYGVFGELAAIGALDPATGAIRAHELPASERASEPLVVGDHVVALCHAHDRAYVAVYPADPARLPDGPVAKIWLDHHVPITFHGVFAPDIS